MKTSFSFEISKLTALWLNRPQILNVFDNDLMIETISALRALNDNPDTIMTVITGRGRFFSAGADLRDDNTLLSNFDQEKYEGQDFAIANNDSRAQTTRAKIAYMAYFSTHVELMRSIIDHRKILVLALNGPAVGGGAAWFTGVADIVLASDNCYLQVPFSALGLVPELGSAPIFCQSMGVHRANEFLMFGRRLEARELESSGLFNRVFPEKNFQSHVSHYLSEVLVISDGQSLLEAKRLMNQPLRTGRLAAVMDSVDALAERFVTGAPKVRFEMKKRELKAKSKKPQSKL